MSFEDNKPLHALLSPSGADRWMVCTGSVALGKDEPDDTSEYADEGTAAHWLASWCLQQSTANGVQEDPVRFLDRKIIVVNGVVWEGGDAPRPQKLKGRTTDIEREIVVDSEFVMHVRRYIQNVQTYAKGALLFEVEQKLPIGHLTEEEDATGTGDVVIVTEDGVEIQAHDLKFGRGVEVKAERNRQLMIYGLGALHAYGEAIEAMAGKLPTRFRAVIHQPRITEAPDEWDCSIEELLEFAVEVRRQAKTAMGVYRDHVAGITRPVAEWNVLVPGEKQCKFCKAKPICPKLAAFVEENVGADFEELDKMSTEPTAAQQIRAFVPGDLTSLGAKARAYDIIEMWGKAVRAKIESVLLDSRNDEGIAKQIGYKLVQGKKGNRKFKDESVVEALLKKKRFKQEDIYDFSLKSPTEFEKLLKKEKPKVWGELQEYIEQKPGQPHVAPLDDKRPTLQLANAADDFDEIKEQHVDAKVLNHTDDEDFSDIA